MPKQEFLDTLREKLSTLPKKEVEERLSFYEEMINDRIEEGRSEEDAVSDIGRVEDITTQIIADIPFLKIAKERIKMERRLKTWEIVLLAVGSPIWLSLGAVLVAITVSLYAVLFSLVVSAWAVFVAFVAGGAFGIVYGLGLVFTGNVLSGMFLFGGACACVGLSIFLFFASKRITKWIVWLTKKLGVAVKKCFIKGEKK